MIALVYLVLMVVVGDQVTRPFFRMATPLHRLAIAFLTGLLLTTWLTYLVALLFAGQEEPLLYGNAVTFAVIGLAAARAAWPAVRRATAGGPLVARPDQPAATDPAEQRAIRWDWVAAGAFTLLTGWMMFTTLQSGGGTFSFGLHEYGDFGPAAALAQSFALGHNLPPEYPLFAGEPILYHFLYYFAVGNLTFLGLEPAMANNLLAVGSLVAMLVIVMAIGARLFGSRLVGRIGATLFFFHGALSFVPWLAAQGPPTDWPAAIWNLEGYLSSGFPYRGEDWAIWTQNVFISQRHLASGIGILLVVLLFVVDRLADRAAADEAAATAKRRGWSASRVGAALVSPFARPGEQLRTGLRDPLLGGFVLGGILLGLLPFWNGAIFLAAAAIFAGLLLLFPIRTQLLVLAVVTAAIAIPQLIALRPDGIIATQYPTFRWGYIIEDATPLNVAVYLAFIFGPKLLLMAVALAGGTSLQRRFFVAITSLVAVAFLGQYSIDISQSHKFLTLWLVLANVYAAYGLVRLWNGGRARLTASQATPGAAAKPSMAGRLLAVVLSAIIVIGGVIDLVPIKNNVLLAIPTTGDRLFEWVRTETDRRSTFLSDIWINHPILLAGRAIYFGWPAYTLALGLDLAEREEQYRQLYSMRSPRDLVRQLQAEDIDYVVFDDPLREGTYVRRPLNEDLYRTWFEVVFDDPQRAYNNITIYRVPTDPDAWRTLPEAPAVDMYTGGAGRDRGNFDGPRGIVVTADGTTLVADTDNNRIQRFDEAGEFVAVFGEAGDGPGQLNTPFGVAVDSRGHTFVADTLHHLVVEFDASDAPVADWGGPEVGFYGPRDVAIDGADNVYVLDQGRARVVRRAPDGAIAEFGEFGSGDGQLNDPTGLGLGPDVLAVADPANRRIVLFDLGGRFIRTISVPEWGVPLQYPDVAVSADGLTLFASSPATAEVFVYSIDGERLGTLAPTDGSVELVEPGSLTVRPDGDVLALDHAASRVVRLASPNR